MLECENRKHRASKSRLSSYNKNDCILCGQTGDGQLYEVSTFATDNNLSLMITELQNSTLLPRVSGVNLIAAEAKYHLKCMTDPRNTTAKLQESCVKDDDKIKGSQAFTELLEYC